MSGLRESHRRQRLARIREAAAALFEERGYAKTTIRDVASRAGVSPGTVMNYAGSKEDLVLMVFAAGMAEAAGEAFASLDRGAPPPKQLLHIFARLLAWFDRRPALSRVLLARLSFAPPEAQKARIAHSGGFAEQLATLIEGWKAQGLVAQSVQPRVAARAAFAIHFGHIVMLLAGDAGGLDATVGHLERSLEHLFEGLNPR